MNLPAIVDEYRRIRASLIAEYPELVHDTEALTDTLDGLHAAQDVVARFVRQSLEDKAAAEALKALEAKYEQRRERIEKRAEAQRTAAFRLMQAIGERSIKRPEFSLTVAPGRARVLVTDRTLLPDEYWRVKRDPNLDQIRHDLAAGTAVPGTTMSNGEDCLTVRVT
jgi:hypothetical protein